MQAETLFLETMEDLRRRTDLRATEYEMVQAAGLVRRLLIDATPLYVSVNQRFRMNKPVFRWGRLSVMVAARNAGAWVPGSWFDPALSDFHPHLQDEKVRARVAHTPPFEGSLDNFLAFEVIRRTFNDGATEAVTVKELIRHYANREGGVHFAPGPAPDPLIADIREQSEEALRLTVLAIGRITYRALEPLATVTGLSQRPGPFGLEATPTIP